MYNKENFNSMFGSALDTTYMIDTVLLLTRLFKYKNILSREDMLGTGDSWSNMACIDKLEELGYISVLNKHDITNYTTYVNVKL